MKLSEIRQKNRELLDDMTGTASLRYWSDPELTEYINACIEELCERTLCVTDSITDSVCLIPLIAGQRHYKISDTILAIQTAQPSWRVLPLDKQSVVTINPSWLTSIGLPHSYLMDYSHSMLSLTSAPATVSGESIRLTAQRLPITELSSDNDISEIPRQYHRSLSDGILSLAYLKQDAEVYNPAKAQGHKAKWEARLAEIVRREARLKPRIIVTRSVEMS